MSSSHISATTTPPWAGLTPNRVKVWTGGRWLGTVVCALLAIFFFIPMLWLITASVDKNASFQLQMPHLTLAHYGTSLQLDNLGGLGNSFIMSAIATVVGTVAAFFAAYSFSRHHIKWKGPILLTILFLSGLPITILIVPMYKMFIYMNWLTIVPASIMLGVTSLPFQIYLLKNFIDAVPLDLEEAAFIERAGTWRVLISVVLPLTMPGLASAALFGFVNAWGSFLIPLVLVSPDNQQPAAVMLFGFMSASSIDYGAIAAYSILYSLPVVILYLFASRHFKAGFMLGGSIR
jgi:multiple sugar transport system permease protein